VEQGAQQYHGYGKRVNKTSVAKGTAIGIGIYIG
jgi:hypothetical protein